MRFNRYLLIYLLVLCFFMASFGIISALEVPLLTDPSEILQDGGWVAFLVSFGLLAGDVILPIPSSLLMIANGALFGIIGGTAVSLAGGLASSAIGYWLGRKGDRVINKYVKPEERARAESLINRWGLVAIIVTRPVPLLSETVSIMAGSARLGGRRFFWASFLGYLPGTLLYAVTGATALDFESGTLAFGLVLAIAGAFWFIGFLMRRSHTEESTSPTTPDNA